LLWIPKDFKEEDGFPKIKVSSIIIFKCFFLSLYNDPLFIGVWKCFSQLVSNLNGRPLEVLPILFSDPKENFGGNFGHGGDPLHSKSGSASTKHINALFLSPRRFLVCQSHGMCHVRVVHCVSPCGFACATFVGCAWISRTTFI
jgi:hypothetical protein